MASDSWDPQLYERFRRERIQPARDLIAMFRPQPEMRVIDLGCGTGEVTRELHEHVRASRTLGIDRSPTMLAQAKPRETTGLRFIEADIASYAPDQPIDLVYSNAALGWVNDHPGLFARFRSWLAPSGQLAIQVPCADWHPTHTVAARLAEQYGTGQLYHGKRRVLEPAAYAELLFSLGFVEQDVLMRVYGHVLDSVDELVAFFSGTLLNPYRAALGEERFADFLGDYRAGLIHEMGDSKPIFFPMTRTLLWGRLHEG